MNLLHLPVQMIALSFLMSYEAPIRIVSEHLKLLTSIRIEGASEIF